MLRFLTAGESHGQGLVMTMDGVPAGLHLDIDALNHQLMGSSANNTSDATLADQRDRYIDQLSELMDIRVITDNLNQVSIFTNSGVQLIGNGAAQFSFDAQGTVGPTTLWNADPTKSNLGTLFLVSPKYIGPLFTTPTGQMVAAGAACSMGLGIFIMNKIATIKV